MRKGTACTQFLLPKIMRPSYPHSWIIAGTQPAAVQWQAAPGGTAFLITVAPTPSKYDSFTPHPSIFVTLNTP